MERFIQEMGYEPIVNERGTIAYGAEEKLEKYAYKEVELSDMLVSIIGGRYGTNSENHSYSISQMELKTALDLGRQVYVFVDRNVMSEYATYINNKDREVRYRFVDNVRVYNFLEEVEALPHNNTLASFDSSQDIVTYLKEQWAGLFQRFLREQSLLREMRILEGMQATAKTLDQLVNFLTEDRQSNNQAIKDILLVNHPAFQQLRKITRAPYRIFFTNNQELKDWLKARRYTEVESDAWDSNDFSEFIITENNKKYLLKIHLSIFDENDKLKVYTGTEWDESWISQAEYFPTPVIDENDLPF